MRRKIKLEAKRRRRRKLFWLFMAAAVCALLYTEQAAALYVLSTLALCGLMLVVAFSNLEDRDHEMQKAAIEERSEDVRRSSRALTGVKRRVA